MNIKNDTIILLERLKLIRRLAIKYQKRESHVNKSDDEDLHGFNEVFNDFPENSYIKENIDLKDLGL